MAKSKEDVKKVDTKATTGEDETKETSVKKAEPIKIVIEWDGKEGEDQAFSMSMTPDPLDPETNIRNHIVVLSNAFAHGVVQLMSLIQPLPQPTPEEIENYEYNFEEHGKEFGEGLFALYNYKKALLDEFQSIVGRVMPDAFHDVMYVKGVQEKIFDKMREELLKRKEEELALKEFDETKKGTTKLS